MNSDKQASIHAIVTLLAAKSEHRHRKAEQRHDGRDDIAIESNLLAEVLATETAIVEYHPTFKGKMKAIGTLLKAAFANKKRNGFIIIGRG